MRRLPRQRHHLPDEPVDVDSYTEARKEHRRQRNTERRLRTRALQIATDEIVSKARTEALVDASDDGTHMSANEIMLRATPLQVKWVASRLLSNTDREASLRIGISEATPTGWSNKRELDWAVSMYLLDTVEAAKMMLRGSAVQAAQALESGLGDPRRYVEAAKIILDRAGIPATSRRELVTGVKSAAELTDDDLAAIASNGGDGIAEPTESSD